MPTAAGLAAGPIESNLHSSARWAIFSKVTIGIISGLKDYNQYASGVKVTTHSIKALLLKYLGLMTCFSSKSFSCPRCISYELMLPNTGAERNQCPKISLRCPAWERRSTTGW
jgi:hypothetical protein